MDASDINTIKDLEDENRRLTQIFTDLNIESERRY
ncbi:transposase [Salmonella enterica subsp. enterica serovar Enteritidis str. 3402]|nr:transposase [Salmonella enterica subsp. enterica serovar Enteritidis str. 3402]